MAESEASSPLMSDDEFQATDSLWVRIVKCKWPLLNWFPSQPEFIPEYILDDGSNYIKSRQLGQGWSGKVYLGTDCSSRQWVAIKEIPVDCNEETIPSLVIREVSLLKELEHPNIVRLLKASSRQLFVCLVFERLHCDLGDVIDQDYIPNSKIIKSYLHQMLSALAYCHAHKILHRDLKPSNILVDVSKKTVKISDFGFARPIGESDTPYTSPIGTLGYMAPEVLLESGQYSTPIDVWSLGCIFAEMVLGQNLFLALTMTEGLLAIFKLFGTPTEETWPGLNELCRFQLHKLPKYPAMDLKEKFPDFEPDGLDLLSKMLILDPTKRISAEGALKHPYFKDLVTWEKMLAIDSSRWSSSKNQEEKDVEDIA